MRPAARRTLSSGIRAGNLTDYDQMEGTESRFRDLAGCVRVSAYRSSYDVYVITLARKYKGNLTPSLHSVSG